MVRVRASSVIDAPLGQVWEYVRDFNSLPRWFPGVTDSRIENEAPSDRVGCIRRFHSSGGHQLREQLLGLSDHDHTCSYSILESPMGVSRYVATLQLAQITDGDRTYLEWIAEFDCSADRTERLKELIGRTCFQGAFDRLKTHFSGRV